jgi:hypothetical protein
VGRRGKKPNIKTGGVPVGFPTTWLASPTHSFTCCHSFKIKIKYFLVIADQIKLFVSSFLIPRAFRIATFIMYRSVLFGAIFFGTLQGVCNAFVIQSYKDLVLQRMDPIVSPGQVSGHVHVFQGSSGLAPTSTYDDIFGGKCSTMGTQEDKSNYWVAQVYGKNANGTLSPLPMSEFRAYYINVRNAIQSRGVMELTSVSYPEHTRCSDGTDSTRIQNDDW